MGINPLAKLEPFGRRYNLCIVSSREVIGIK